jgi:hypothetical protein
MRNVLLLVLCIGMLAPWAWGEPRESVTFTEVISNGALNSASNSLRSAVFTGDYTVTRVRVAGTLTKINTQTLAREARIQVTPPSGPSFILQPFTQGSFAGSISTSTYVFTLAVPVAPAAGEWNFRFYESFDDPGNDARWDTITFTLDDSLPDPPVAEDLGTLALPTTLNRAGSLSPGMVRWYKLTLAEPVTAAGLRYLDITTAGSVVGAGDDTEIALYNASGVRLAEDDDDGPGNTSLLSFGAGSRIGASQGQDGDLAAGTFYVAVAGFDATFGPGFMVSTTNGSIGQIALSVTHAPTPVTISGASPVTLSEGDILTVTGTGFGADAHALNVMLLTSGGVAVPVRVTSAAQTTLTGVVGVVPANATGVFVRVARGAAAGGAFTPARLDLVNESQSAASGWNGRTGPASATLELARTLVGSAPVTDRTRIIGVRDGDAVRLNIPAGAGTNALMSVEVTLDAQATHRTRFTLPAIRVRSGQRARDIAQAAADLIRDTYAQRAPLLGVVCEVQDGPAGEALLRVRAAASPGGGAVALSAGWVKIELWVAEEFVTPSGLAVTGFGGAELQQLGSDILAERGTDEPRGWGLTLDLPEEARGAAALLNTVFLEAPGEEIGVTAWRRIGPAGVPTRSAIWLQRGDEELTLRGVWPGPGGATLRVYMGSTYVGEAEVEDEALAEIETGGGPASVAAGGFLLHPDGPRAGLTFGEPVKVHLGDGRALEGDRVRLLMGETVAEGEVVVSLDVRANGLETFTLVEGAEVVPPPPCPADFNRDGGVDGADIGEFFSLWEDGDESADVNVDGGVDGEDVTFFFAAWEAGGCED